MTPRAMFDFIVNTGEFYDPLCRLARSPDTVSSDWDKFVKHTALRAYRKQFKEPYEGLTLEDIVHVGFDIGSHFHDHIMEMDA